MKVFLFVIIILVQSQTVTEATDTEYKHIAKGCVNGNNIIKYADKSISECEDYCDADTNCLAFEYGVAYGGSSGSYKPRDCQLQSSANYNGCNGANWNLDLYIKTTSGISSFGVKTLDQIHADSSDTITVSLWIGGTEYQCSYNGMARNTEYECTVNEWTEISNVCDDGTADYKLVIDNSDIDAVMIDFVYLNLDGSTYMIDGFCIPEGEEPVFMVTESQYDWAYSPNSCPNGYSGFHNIGIDTEVAQFAPNTVILYFDLGKPDETSYDALWEDATDICIDHQSDGCQCATASNSPLIRTASFNPIKSNVIGTYEVGNAVHIEFDLTINSYGSGWQNIIHCTTYGAESDYPRLPGIWYHGSGGNGFHSKFSNNDNRNYGGDYGGALVAGHQYHFEMDITDGTYKVTINGVVYADDVVASHSNYLGTVTCYASDPWFNAADVTISNLVIGDPVSISSAIAVPATVDDNAPNGNENVHWKIPMEDIDRVTNHLANASGVFSMTLSMEDMVIIVLSIVNVVALIILCVVCCGKRTKGVRYQRVVVDSDLSEMEIVDGK